MNKVPWPFGLISAYLSKRAAHQRACAFAQEAFAAFLCEEPIFSIQVFAEEPNRYVVRVFYGRRPPTGHKMPPWRECLVFVVDKETSSVQQLTDEKYQPRLR